MKKIIYLMLCSLFFELSANASNWVEIFEKQYIDFESIEISNDENIVKFWNKSLRKDPKEVFPLNNKPYWYFINKWAINCKYKKVRIEAMNVYDLKQNVIYSDEVIPTWDSIIPDSYADGFYRLFCIVPFDENPLFNR